MSTTENQNGTATAGAQSNGIKTLSSSSSASSTASSTASSGVSPSAAGRVGLSNNSNSSFLYSSTMLSREKARQVPPPTLPKYTSSFNAGSNGGGGGTADRLGRDREAGGSYRLASLDRLALRQRILDGEKTNGESISVSERPLCDDRCASLIPRTDTATPPGHMSSTVISSATLLSFFSSWVVDAPNECAVLRSDSAFSAIFLFSNFTFGNSFSLCASLVYPDPISSRSPPFVI